MGVKAHWDVVLLLAWQCDCSRCMVEAADEQNAPPPTGTGDVDLTYVALYVLKHTCAVCLGTLAPVQLKDPSSCECNRCGITRTEAEFMERVQAHFEGGDSHEHDDDDDDDDD